MTNNIKKIKFFRGTRWILVFYHDSSTGEYFDDTIAQTCNVEYCDDLYRYSRLRDINELNKIYSNYEFYLDYPEVDKYIIWTQKITPLEGTETASERNNGFKLKYTHNAPLFSGLMKSRQAYYAPIDGSIDPVGFWYCIGAKKSYEEGKNTITGPEALVQKVYLWMRTGLIECSQKRSFFNRGFLLLSCFIIH